MDKQITKFGQYLEEREISYQEAAAQLGVTRSYVGMLARGDHAPALELAFKIADWSKGEVVVESWAEVA